jgi:trimethylguanosine synthase
MGKKPKFTGLSRFLPQDFLNPNATSLSEESQNQSKPAKKRKPDAHSPVCTRYDATALVPHYTTAHEVPENLQKCPSSTTIFEGPYDSIPAVSQIFRNESDTFLYTTKDVY